MIPDSKIMQCSVRTLAAPLNQPFRIASGQHDRMENALFTVELGDGTRGFGEAGVATHITGETLSETQHNLERMGDDLVGRSVSTYPAISAWLHERLPRNKSAVAAMEMALLDAFTRQMRIPLWQLFGSAPKKLATDITIVVADQAETVASARKFYRAGFRKFKIKIGRNAGLDLERVRSVHRWCPSSQILLDANQAFTPAAALDFVRELRKIGIIPSLLEQPVAKADWEGLREVAVKSRIPVCADETASSLENCWRLIREKVVPVINLKLMKTGILPSREIARWCRAKGVKLMIGAMMEGSLSSMAAAHLAAGMGCFDYIDLDTPFFIQRRHDRNPYLSSAGVYSLSLVKAGIGIVPKQAAEMNAIP
jgi:L-Ala-D/L-Glu epimerase